MSAGGFLKTRLFIYLHKKNCNIPLFYQILSQPDFSNLNTSVELVQHFRQQDFRKKKKK